MFGFRRKTRPFELGPYPMEKLRRDKNIIIVEAKRDSALPKPMPIGNNPYLVSATNTHLYAYVELREPEPAIKKAPVPDDLVLRTRDIKGAGFFMDASQIGIFEVVDNLWSGVPNKSHKYAVVVLVEYSAEIDDDNIAAGWVAGNEHLLATLMAAEIGIDLSGQIASMGYASKVHWTGATDVDLDKATVLAGLGIRSGEKVRNPYVGNRFAVAVVTTDYELEVDLPLSESIKDGKNLSYMLGLSGAISGLERWRRRRRASHLGPYPVETLKRVGKLTTHVFDDEVPRVPSRTNMYVRTAFGDLSQKAQDEGDRWSQKHPVSQGIVRPSWAIKPLQDGQVAAEVAPGSDNPNDNTKALKALSYYLGSAITGVCKVPDYAWYSHDKRGAPRNVSYP